MIEALVSGKLHGQPAQKTGRTGTLFVVAKVRAHAGDADVFVNVIAFSQAACEALLALGDGDAVALAGSLTPKAWIDREGPACAGPGGQPGLDGLPCDSQAQGARAQAAWPIRIPAGKPA